MPDGHNALFRRRGVASTKKRTPRPFLSPSPLVYLPCHRNFPPPSHKKRKDAPRPVSAKFSPLLFLSSAKEREGGHYRHPLGKKKISAHERHFAPLPVWRRNGKNNERRPGASFFQSRDSLTRGNPTTPVYIHGCISVDERERGRETKDGGVCDDNGTMSPMFPGSP